VATQATAGTDQMNLSRGEKISAGLSFVDMMLLFVMSWWSPQKYEDNNKGLLRPEAVGVFADS
ncbi:hypothetical protein AVEN_164441-1, partial [Araneus ventricosus]